jgi:hypothetical protein
MKDRSVLLPPYMSEVPVWQDLITIIDTVFENAVDNPTQWLAQLRFLWILTSDAIDKVNSGQLLSTSDFELPEKEILIKQAKQLGFDFQQTDLITSEDYQRIVRNIALFWYSKGKPNFVDFLGFVVEGVVSIVNLWSNSADAGAWNTYGTFLEEGDPGIGTPVWGGGTWFPTTHVRVVFDPFKFSAPQMTKLVNLFYTVANFNLVLESITMEGNLYVHTVDDPQNAPIVVTYPLIDIDMNIDSL